MLTLKMSTIKNTNIDNNTTSREIITNQEFTEQDIPNNTVDKNDNINEKGTTTLEKSKVENILPRDEWRKLKKKLSKKNRRIKLAIERKGQQKDVDPKTKEEEEEE